MQDWSTIGVGDIVELKGNAWQCTDRAGGVVTIEDKNRKTFTGTPTGPVKVISTALMDMELATALVTVRLGGLTVATKDDKGRWLVPATYSDVGSLLTHMFLLHGVKVTSDSIRDGLKKHEWLHRPENKVAGEYVEHYHDPEFYRERDYEPPPALAAP
jgi:hypothetical protein